MKKEKQFDVTLTLSMVPIATSRLPFSHRHHERSYQPPLRREPRALHDGHEPGSQSHQLAQLLGPLGRSL